MRSTLLSLFILSGLLLGSCGDTETPTEDLVAKGGKQYGGDFKFMSPEKIKILFPTHTADLYSSRLISQLYEPLMVFDVTEMEVVPGVAESFEKSADSKVYTFKIRKGIKFHKDDCFGGDGDELTADDVKFTFDLACSALEENQIGYLLKNKIVGADAYYKKSTKSIPKGGISGITVSGNEVKFTLAGPSPGFERILTNPSLGIVSKTAYEHYGTTKVNTHPVGTGPFMLESMEDSKIVLKRHDSYWRKDEFGNQLPFLSQVIMTCSKDKRSEFLAFRKEEIDLVLEIPVEEIDHILGSLEDAQNGKNVKHKVDGQPSLSMTYIAMACESDEFSDVKVRKAFNVAIDRETIIEKWLEGEGSAALNGFVPVMAGYDNEAVHGHVFNADRAKALMSQAGYPNGANFPTLDFYVNAKEGSGIHKMCQAIVKQLKESINVNLNIKLCTIAEREKAIVDGKAKIWRSGWIADYPGPENFLGLFYSGNLESSSMVNSFKFSNADFDKAFEAASSEGDLAKRAGYLVKCDQIVIDQAATMPVLTGAHIVMINARVRNFAASPMESLNLTGVFIKEQKKNQPQQEGQ
ncbi:MAG: oligopeptide transport system substrate-binding protein [Crocinitomicaceae bacterium]|jgi:oligopeptide transport system substrate-binding protein